MIDESAEALGETERLNRAREDARMSGLRDLLMQAITLTVDLWSTDASVGDVGFQHIPSISRDNFLTPSRFSVNL